MVGLCITIIDRAHSILHMEDKSHSQASPNAVLRMGKKTVLNRVLDGGLMDLPLHNCGC